MVSLSRPVLQLLLSNHSEAQGTQKGYLSTAWHGFWGKSLLKATSRALYKWPRERDRVLGTSHQNQQESPSSLWPPLIRVLSWHTGSIISQPLAMTTFHLLFEKMGSVQVCQTTKWARQQCAQQCRPSGLPVTRSGILDNRLPKLTDRPAQQRLEEATQTQTCSGQAYCYKPSINTFHQK